MASLSKRGNSFYDFAKRVLDVVSAIILLILFSPIMLLTAILIKLTSPA